MPSARNPVKPTPGDARKLDASRKAASAAIRMAFDGARPRPHTDLFSTLRTVADQLKNSPGRRPVLVFLSDMLHSTRDLDMETQNVAASRVTELEKQGSIPPLPESCVIVVGADDGGAKGQRVRAFWSAYFKAAGASLDRDDYRYEATDVSSFRCFSRVESERLGA